MTTGPVPKRSDQRRRRNQPDVPVTPGAARPATAPEPDEGWHPVAKAWFLSLADSGQSDFYQASDWATALVLAESMSRELLPQPVTTGVGADAVTELIALPPKAASVAAWLKGMTALLATEGDRRRMRLELAQVPAVSSGPDEVEDELDAHRRRAGKPTDDSARGSA